MNTYIPEFPTAFTAEALQEQLSPKVQVAAQTLEECRTIVSFI